MLRSKRKRFKNNGRKFFRYNERIRVPKVTIIDENGLSLGIIETARALTMAKERELDLVEVSPKATPPVCRILNYGQFLYQQSRKLQAQKAHAKKVEIKVIRISFKIGRHDLDLKLQQAKKFLERGDKVKIEMILRGRERQHKEKGYQLINEFVKNLGAITIEQPLKIQDSRISVLVYQIK